MESSLLVVSIDIMKRNMIESQLKPIGINNDLILSEFCDLDYTNLYNFTYMLKVI